MKTLISLCLALVAVSSAGAQIFRPGGVNRAIARGHQDHAPRDGGYVYRGGHDYGRGHYGHSRHYHRHHHGHYVYRHAPVYRYVPSFGYYSGYGYGYPYYDTYGYHGSGSAAANGLLLGALAGGIIGHNSGDFRHNGWRGAAWGAGAGWLLGSVIDANRRAVVYDTAPVVVQQAPAVQAQAQPAAPAQPQQVTIINNYYNSSTPMSAANGLFGR